MNTAIKVIGILFGILYTMGGIVQYNDPDPMFWMFVYGIAAITSFVFAFKKLSKLILLALGIAFLIGFFFAYPETFEGFEIGKGNIKNVEEGREAFGLFLMSLTMFLFTAFTYFANKD